VDVAASSGFGHTKLRPRGADGWVPGTAMAVGVHLMLVAALALNVRWKVDNPQVIEAEMWSEIPQAAAPVDLPPPPVVAPEPLPRTVEAPREEDVPPPQEKMPDLVVAPKPKKDDKKPKKPPVEVFESAPPKVAKKPEKKPEKPPEKKLEKKLETAKAEPKKPVVPPVPDKPVNSKVTSPEGTGKTAAEREAQRKENLQRMMNQLGGMGASQSSGPSASYAGRIRARIKPRIVFTDSIGGNPTAVVEVRCGPDGRILSRKMVESSGVPRWDEAVLRAIDATEVLPADEGGKVPPVMELSFRPNDM
jgi:colicin import membrane protein